jgi:O-Antigen ligase
MSGARLAGAARGRLAVAAGTVAVFTWWAVHDGGAAPASWYPGALLFLAVFVAATWAHVGAAPGRPAAWAATALAAFTVWSFLSLAWADARGDAWDGANRTLLYLAVFTLFALVPWRPTEAALFLAAFAIATAVAGMWSVADALSGSDHGAFVDGRLAGPVGYENASAALFLAAFWPAVMLAARPGLPGPARGVLLAASGVLLELVVLCQSRGSLLAAGAALIVALAITRERRRLLLALAAVSGVALLTLPFLLDVYGSAGSSGDDALLRAGLAMTASAAALMAAGVAGSRLAVRPRGAVAFALMGAVAVSGLGVAVAGASSSRFAGGAESGRYDFWRVAWRQFARHPLHGAGADNFAHEYAREGRRHEEPLYPHSVVLRTLGQTGLVGAVLLVAFLLAACAATRPWTADAVTAAALVSALAWLAHASIDWLWELPALGGPAMACLGLVAARGGPPQAPSPRKTRRFAVATTVVAIAAAVSCALPGLAAWEIERAVPAWDDDPAGARQRLERARGLNPLSDRPDAIAGTLALEDGDIAGARDAFRRAAARDPGNWYVQMQLAVVDLRQARRTTAVAGLTLARRLNPLEPAIGVALAAAHRGERVPAEVEAYVSGLAVPGPRGRHPVHCRPVLGLGTACGEPPA